MTQKCCCVSDDNTTSVPTGGELCRPDLLTKLKRAKLAEVLIKYAEDIPILNGLIAQKDSAGASAWLDGLVTELQDKNAYPNNREINAQVWLTTSTGQGQPFALSANSPSGSELSLSDLSSGDSYAELILTAVLSEQQSLLGQSIPDEVIHVQTPFGRHARLVIRALTLRDPDFHPCPEPTPTPDPCSSSSDSSSSCSSSSKDCHYIPKRCKGGQWSLLH